MILEQKTVTCEIDEEGFNLINVCDDIMNDIDAIIKKIWNFNGENLVSWADDNDPDGKLQKATANLDDAKNWIRAFKKYVYDDRVKINEKPIIN